MANPATSIVGPHKDRTVLFWINPAGILGMNQHLDVEDVTDTWDSNGCPVFAILPTPNHISAVYNNGMIRVYGMIQHVPPETRPQYTISELSPTVRYVPAKKDQEAMTTTLDKVAVVSDDRRRSWFYYFKRQSEAGDVQLKSSFIKERNPFQHATVKNANPALESQLAAVYLPETNTRVVVYQKADNTICLVTIDDDDHATIQDVGLTTGSLKSTPLTITYTGTDKNRALHLYYLNNVHMLNRATGTWTTNSWQFTPQPKILKEGSTASPATQLAVTNDSKGTNRLFYIPSEGTEYIDIKDFVGTE